MRREFFRDFLKFSEHNKFPNLEIDARICIFAYLKKQFKVMNKSLTIYNYDQLGISSNYRKYSLNWWRKRNDAFQYMKLLMDRMNIKFIPSYDFYITKLINFFI